MHTGHLCMLLALLACFITRKGLANINSTITGNGVGHEVDNVTSTGNGSHEDDSGTSTGSGEGHEYDNGTSTGNGENFWNNTRYKETIGTLDNNAAYTGSEEGIDGHRDTDMIRQAIAANDTQTFLSSFPNVRQRYVIGQHLSYCPYTSLCGHSLSLGRRSNIFSRRPCCEECSCDVSTCHLYNSCCPDLKKLPPYSKLPFGKPTLECHSIHLSKKSQFLQQSIFMFASCPRGSNETARQLCTMSYDDDDDVSHFSDIVPVTRTNDSLIYRNKYCAFCNKVTESEITYWDAKLSCKHGHTVNITAERNVIKDILNNEKCDVEFEPDHKMNMKYCQASTSGCNMTGLWETYDRFLEEACAFYRTPHRQAKGLQQYYDNTFCMLCNGHKPSDYKCFKGITNPTDMPSFSAILNFKFFADSGKQYKPGRCGTGSIFDPYQSSCKHLYCSSQRKLRNGECFKLHPKIGMTVYEAYVRVKPEQDLTVQTAHDLVNQILSWLRVYIEKLFPYPEYSYFDCTRQLIYKVDLDGTESNDAWQSGIKESKLLYFDVKVRFLQGEFHDPDAMSQTLEVLENMSTTFVLNDEMFTFTTSLRDDTSYMYDLYMNVTIAKHVDKDTKTVDATLSDMMSEARPSADDGKVIFPHLDITSYYTRCHFVKIKSRLKVASIQSCPMLNISYRQFLTRPTTDGIYFIQRRYLLKNSDFYYIDDSSDHIGVCSETYFEFAEHVHESNANPVVIESAVAIVAISVSIFSLLLTTATFVLFPKLRAVIGKFKIVLVLSLLIAQSMYLIGSFDPIATGSVACKVLGAVVHFCWLHYMCWVHVCTFHMLHVLWNAGQSVNVSSNTRFCVYNAYSTLVPTTIVALTIVLSITSFGSDDIGYGETVCYISSRNMAEYMLSIPVVIVILTNIAMLLCAAYKVKVAGETEKMIEYDKPNMTFLAKLTTLMGITWSFSFIYDWTHAVVFWYIFIVLNASQGLFLFLSFVLNKHVLDMCYDKMFGEHRGALDESGAKCSCDHSE